MRVHSATMTVVTGLSAIRNFGVTPSQTPIPGLETSRLPLTVGTDGAPGARSRLMRT